jgi:hypothetical protein
MTFSPVIPSSGLTGWSFLQRTLETQEDLFAKSPEIQRDIEYFKENIGNIKTLDDFMGDRQTLKVALGAFGLGDEIDKGAFVRKVLEEGIQQATTESSASFAVRLNNSDYLSLAETFNFDSGELSLSTDVIDEIADKYERQSFEIDVGEIDNTMRLSLNFERRISEFVGQGSTVDGGWFSILGSVPMRTVVEGAFNLPSEFAALDIDQQVDILKDKASRKYGDESIEVFADPENVESLIKDYLLRQEIDNGPSASTPGFAALTILGGGTSGVGSGTILNILLSNS